MKILAVTLDEYSADTTRTFVIFVAPFYADDSIHEFEMNIPREEYKEFIEHNQDILYASYKRAHKAAYLTQMTEKEYKDIWE